MHAGRVLRGTRREFGANQQRRAVRPDLFGLLVGFRSIWIKLLLAVVRQIRAVGRVQMRSTS